ncbi:MAG: FKBP-type peptidyl-prolyl cis-trans isomerase [Phycisphaerales bacterium]|nr:FKBP-type peptidyl-prolyl cis-trans isomerase [Phycisphaerales bacterium]
MRHRRALNQFFLCPIVLATSVAVFGTAGCKSGTSEVSPTNRPSDGDGSHVQEQMAAANAPQEERRAEANQESAAGEAANRQLANSPPPAPAASAQPAATPAPETKNDPKPEAKAETKPEAKAEPKPEPKPEAKAEAKPNVTFLNADTATALSSKTADNGLVIEELKIGEGAEAKSGAVVTINYHGTLKEGGTLVDSTRGKQPATYPLNRLIKGWQQGVPGMKPGGIRRLTIPSALAYGDAGRPPVIPPKSDLIFIIELVQVVEPSK